MKKEVETIRKNQMKLLDWKNTVSKMKNYYMGLITDQTQLKKRRKNLKAQQNPSKLKKRKKGQGK